MIDEVLRIYDVHEILVENKLGENPGLGRPVNDSRELKAGDCFIAIKGANFDGHSYIRQARKLGATCCIGESADADIVVSDSRKATALYAKVFYGDPSARMLLFGVTGTNGKTTSSLMLHQMLLALGYKAGWIGTLGYKIGEMSFPTSHTTPDILQLNSIFKEMYDNKVSHVVMEVSSHALALDRVYAIDFDYCLFTNLSRDHLDFHKNMDDYFEAKYLLFERAARDAAISIVNIGDSYGEMIQQRLLQSGARCFGISRKDTSDFIIEDVKVHLDGSEFNLIGPGSGFAHINSPLVGDFNVDNLALACATLIQTGVKPEAIPELCTGLKPVKGRIEAVANDRGLGLYIDYAHSPDALDNLLRSLEKLPHERIITVFGAGGDRDKGKRPLMLKAALSHSDAVIITDDNPRNENPEMIIYDIVKDTELNLPWWIIRDRAQAIAAAIRLAMPKDIVVICGKGHESYQEIGSVRYDFDDHLVAETALSNIPHYKEDDELLLPADALLLKIIAQAVPQGEACTKPSTYRYVSTDSRTCKAQSIFFAIKGENFDGNNFVEDILKDPDKMAVTTDRTLNHERCIFQNNAELLMAALLKKYLLMFPLYKIALTGSTGKTSTKELLYQVLSSKADTLKTLRNENNIIGLCRTILRVLPSHRYGIFEIGTNHFGEIALLADTIVPDAGIILNVGPSHLQYFGNENGVFQEKSALFNRALNLRVYPADDERFALYREDGVGVGTNPGSNFMISGIQSHEDFLSFFLNEAKYCIPYRARHYVFNSAFAIVTALHLGFSREEIQKALSQAVELELRMQVEQRGQGALIIDCYNANPVSMQSAIEFWHGYQPDKPHVAILGDMLELGESAQIYHQMIGAILADSGEDSIYSVGSFSRLYHTQESKHYAKVQDLLADFPCFPDNAVILVKASHGIRLEKLLPALRGEI